MIFPWIEKQLNFLIRFWETSWKYLFHLNCTTIFSLINKLWNFSCLLSCTSIWECLKCFLQFNLQHFLDKYEMQPKNASVLFYKVMIWVFSFSLWLVFCHEGHDDRNLICNLVALVILRTVCIFIWMKSHLS